MLIQQNRTRALAAFLYVNGLVQEDLPPAEIVNTAQLVMECIDQLVAGLDELSDDSSDETMQSVFYESGKLHFSTQLRWWFEVLYRILLRQKEGPRLGQFTKIMTIDWVLNQVRSTVNDPWKSLDVSDAQRHS